MFKVFHFWGGFYQWFYLEIQDFYMQGVFLNRIIFFTVHIFHCSTFVLIWATTLKDFEANFSQSIKFPFQNFKVTSLYFVATLVGAKELGAGSSHSVPKQFNSKI